MNDLYIPMFSKPTVDKVIKKINPQKSRACNNNVLLSANDNFYSGNYYGHSLKRSYLNECSFRNANFDHTSFCGSILKNVRFQDPCTFKSVYLEECTLEHVTYEKDIYMENCSFYHSYIKDSIFNCSEMRGNHFNDCYIVNCTFNNSTIRATMFDSAYLANCSFKNCNMRNLNIEFATMKNCQLDGSIISYFQFPYIIGIFEDLSESQNIRLAYNDKDITLKQYYNEIDEAIIYFTYLKEYFPLANLYYVKDEKEIAYNCLKTGIANALIKFDIRMVGNFCKLGQFYELFSISDIQTILKQVDETIENQKGNCMYGLLIEKSYQLKSIIAQNRNKSKLEIIVNTNVNASEFSIVSEFCQELDEIITNIMSGKITTSYQLSHNSPFEICVTCVGLTADLIAISTCIYSFISKKMDGKMSAQMSKYIEKSNQMFLDSLNNQFDDFECIIKNTKKSEQTSIIKDFRAKIIDCTMSQINKDFDFMISQ